MILRVASMSQRRCLSALAIAKLPEAKPSDDPRRTFAPSYHLI